MWNVSETIEQAAEYLDLELRGKVWPVHNNVEMMKEKWMNE